MFEVALQLWRRSLKTHPTQYCIFKVITTGLIQTVACDNPRRQHMEGGELKENQEIKVSWRQEGN